MVRLVGAIAAALGHVVRLALLLWPVWIRVLGFSLMSYSVWLSAPKFVWGFVGLSIFLLIAMHRPTDRRGSP